MRVIFMGTPDFAVPTLERLCEDGHEVVLAVTQADKPRGRGQQMKPTPVKGKALQHNIPVYQPEKLKTDEAYAYLASFGPDVIVVVAYGKILPQRILDLPRYGCINVHASLLPRYRGAAPIQWAVLNGETEAGVTTMQMAAGLDTGDMLLRSRRPLPEDMTGGELHDLLAQDGALLLSRTLRALESGDLHPEKQDDSLSCYAPMLEKSMGRIDWNRPARQLHNQVRGLNPWPSAVCRFAGKALKVHRSRVGDGKTDERPGTVVKLDPFTVACGEGTTLELLEVQYEGAKRMPAADFLRGHPAHVGMRLDEPQENPA